MRNYAEAIRCYDKTLEIDPKFAATWYSKGNTLCRMGMYGEAIKCFDKAIEIDPSQEQTKRNREIAREKMRHIKAK